MHIPDGFLTAGVTGITWAGAGLGVAAALRAEKSDPNPMPAGILGATAAFVFAAQMINIPVAPGISGHLVGAALSAVLLGPWRAVIVMAVVLAVQALLFQDGGITALGANTLDMGVAASLTGFAVASLASRWNAHAPRAGRRRRARRVRRDAGLRRADGPVAGPVGPVSARAPSCSSCSSATWPSACSRRR